MTNQPPDICAATWDDGNATRICTLPPGHIGIHTWGIAKRLAEIRERAEAALPGPWRWFGNTETDQVYLATEQGGRIFVLAPHIERVEGYMRTDEPYDFITEEEYERLNSWNRVSYARHAKTTLHLQLHGDPHLVSHRGVARYEVLDGKTRAEAGLPAEADRSNSRLYREDFIGLDNAEADFIAHSRADVSWLLAHIEQLQRELANAVMQADL